MTCTCIPYKNIYLLWLLQEHGLSLSEEKLAIFGFHAVGGSSTTQAGNSQAYTRALLSEYLCNDQGGLFTMQSPLIH